MFFQLDLVEAKYVRVGIIKVFDDDFTVSLALLFFSFIFCQKEDFLFTILRGDGLGWSDLRFL
jgi:hypothetical protein